MAWAAENGLTEGKSADRFDPTAPVTRDQLAPQGAATRAEIARIFMNLLAE